MYKIWIFMDLLLHSGKSDYFSNLFIPFFSQHLLDEWRERTSKNRKKNGEILRIFLGFYITPNHPCNFFSHRHIFIVIHRKQIVNDNSVFFIHCVWIQINGYVGCQWLWCRRKTMVMMSNEYIILMIKYLW